MRRITLFVSAILMALFATVLVNGDFVLAQTSPMATWSGENIKYKEEDWNWEINLSRSDNPTSDSHVPPLTNSPCENAPSVYYSSIGTFGADQDNAWLYVICLSSPYDGSDKSQPIPAMFLQYNASLGTSSAKEFKLQGTREVTVAAEGTDSSGQPIEDSESDSSTSPCNSKYSYGLSWIVCPVTNWLAAGTDALFNVLKGFLIVSPLLGENGTTLYYAWGIMRNFANILFIIAFLVIIYSQITNYGISNYGIKRLMPRLVIAAVLVNMSYWLSALAVDLSNVLGMSLQSLFLEIRNNIPPSPNVTADDITFSAMAGAVLSGSAAALGAGFVAMGVVATAGASIWFLLVSLVGVMVSALVAILVLAARQALITILIIVSPLAFVAFLLPSTEKYFDRWKTIFVTLLMVFPILSVVFGGSQLAGLIIVHSALEHPDNENFFNLIILGMVVQIIPFVITPLLVRLSGSVAGRIAGIVNNPNKGIVDKTRKFAQNRHDMTKNRRLWALDKNGNFSNNNPLARGGRRMALREMNNSHRLKAWESGAIAAYEQDSRAHDVYRQTALNEMRKTAGENEGKAEFAHEVAHNTSLRRIDTMQRLTREEAELAENQNKTLYELARTNPAMANIAIRDLAQRADDAYDSTKQESMRLNTINQTQEGRFYERMIANPDSQNYAGAVEVDIHGPTRVLNISQEAESKARENRVNAAISTLSRTEAKLSEERAVILGNAAAAGEYANLTSDTESRSGALRRYISRAPIKDVQSLLEELDITMSANGDVAAATLRSELAGALQKRKPFYISNTVLNRIEEGTLDTTYRGAPGKKLLLGEALNAGALGTQTMVTADRDDLAATVQYFRDGGTISADARDELKKELRTAFTDTRYRSQMDKRIKELSELWTELGMGPRP